MNAATVVAYTDSGALVCPDCIAKIPAHGHACGEPGTIADPGWCGCGERGPDGAPCRIVPDEGDEPGAVFADGSASFHGYPCETCGLVFVDDETRGPDWETAEDYRASIRWCASWNLPGCLPDSDEPAPRFGSDEDARQYIIDALERAADDAEDEDTADALALLAEDVNLSRGEDSWSAPDGYVYWIQDTQGDEG